MAAFTDARERWNRRYTESTEPLFGAGPNQWLASQATHLEPGSHVLSIADGDGRNALWLASQGHQVQGFDVSEIAVDKARKKAAANGLRVDLAVADVESWVWQADRYDAVAAIFIQFADPQLRTRIFAGIAQTLKPDGLLIIEGYGPRQMQFRTGGPGIVEHLYTLDLLSSAFAGWAVLSSRDTVAILSEGTGHAGTSHLISMTLRKPQSVQASR